MVKNMIIKDHNKLLPQKLSASHSSAMENFIALGYCKVEKGKDGVYVVSDGR